MVEGDLTVAILREIRDEIRSTNTRLDVGHTELKAELASGRIELKAELVSVRAELAVVGETLKDLAMQQLMLGRYIKNVVDRHEVAIGDLRERMARVEAGGNKPPA